MPIYDNSTRAFDKESSEYDSIFTNSFIGIAQRSLVWQELIKTIGKEKIQTILEINCGTGEDAVFINHLGIKVFPTDISKEMVNIANAKLKEKNYLSNAQVCDCRNLNLLNLNAKVDLIFSNFGGLNCIDKDEFKNFFVNSKFLFKERENYFLVLMAKNTLWEKLFFLIKGKFSQINRRNTTMPIDAAMKYESISTFYYSIKEIEQILPKHLIMKKTTPIGFFIPPSYMEKWILKNPRIFKFLKLLDSRIQNFSILSNFSDHFIVQITERN